ncbi:lysophospholipid acyltransferase family protein [Halovulum sp. GXIMD14793]
MIRHFASALSALLGMGRSGLGSALLKRQLRRSDGQSYAEQKATAWDLIIRNAWLFRGRALHANRFLVDWQSLALHKLSYLLPSPPTPEQVTIDWIGNEVVDEALAKGRGAIAVSVHAGLSLAILSYPCQRQRSVSLIVDTPTAKKKFHNGLRFGATRAVAVIPSDHRTLLRVRADLKKGNFVMGMSDDTRRRPYSLCHDLRLSDGLFRCAEIAQVPVIFAISNATSEGRIRVVYEAAPDGSAEVVGEAFRQFLMRQRPEHPVPEIVSAKGTRAIKRKSLDDFWVPDPVQRRCLGWAISQSSVRSSDRSVEI